MNALVYEQAREIVAQRWAVEHEAAHVAAAIVLGIGVKEVRVADIPEKGTLGIVHFEHIELTPEVVRKRAMITIAGPLGERKPGWPWPPLEDAEATHDEKQLAAMARYLKLDAKGWRELCVDAMKLIATREFCALENAFRFALERWPVLDQAAVKEIVAITKRHQNGVPHAA